MNIFGIENEIVNKGIEIFSRNIELNSLIVVSCIITVFALLKGVNIIYKILFLLIILGGLVGTGLFLVSFFG